VFWCFSPINKGQVQFLKSKRRKTEAHSFPDDPISIIGIIDLIKDFSRDSRFQVYFVRNFAILGGIFQLRT
jgi:hypothetical protein